MHNNRRCISRYLRLCDVTDDVFDLCIAAISVRVSVAVTCGVGIGCVAGARVTGLSDITRHIALYLFTTDYL